VLQQFEAKLYGSSNAKRRELLCPPLYCSPAELVLVMRRVNPMTDDEVRKYVWPLIWNGWDYMGGNDDDQPFEPKAADWGWLYYGNFCGPYYANLTTLCPSTIMIRSSTALTSAAAWTTSDRVCGLS
jgi:hypothetical protein